MKHIILILLSIISFQVNAQLNYTSNFKEQGVLTQVRKAELYKYNNTYYLICPSCSKWDEDLYFTIGNSLESAYNTIIDLIDIIDTKPITTTVKVNMGMEGELLIVKENKRKLDIECLERTGKAQITLYELLKIEQFLKSLL